MSREQDYEGYKWIKVKRYTDDPSKSWEERYAALEVHHVKETTFLLDEVRKLAKEIDEIKRPKSVEEMLAKMKEEWSLTDEEIKELER